MDANFKCWPKCFDKGLIYMVFLKMSLLYFHFVAFISIHTYIHTYVFGHYNPSIKIIDLVSHTTYVVWWDLQFKESTPNGRFFLEKPFMAIFIYSQNFCQKCAERKSPKNHFLYFVLIPVLGLEPWFLRLIIIIN